MKLPLCGMSSEVEIPVGHGEAADPSCWPGNRDTGGAGPKIPCIIQPETQILFIKPL